MLIEVSKIGGCNDLPDVLDQIVDVLIGTLVMNNTTLSMSVLRFQKSHRTYSITTRIGNHMAFSRCRFTELVLAAFSRLVSRTAGLD